MDAIAQLLMEYGYGGMFIAALLAGSVLPFNSEIVMVGLAAAGLEPIPLIIWGSLGNIAGGMTCYMIGRLGRLEWIEKYLKIKKEKIDRTRKFLAGKGAWMAIFGFLPLMGSAICITLGLMRANIIITFIAMAIGKTGRYVFCAFAPKLLNLN